MKTKDKKKKDQIIKAMKGMKFVTDLNHQIDFENSALFFEFRDSEGKVFKFGYRIKEDGSINWRGDTPEKIELTLPAFYYRKKNSNIVTP